MSVKREFLLVTLGACYGRTGPSLPLEGTISALLLYEDIFYAFSCLGARAFDMYV